MGTGELDAGYDGRIGGPQFQIVFRAVGLGRTQIELGEPFGGGLIIAGGARGVVHGTTVDLRVIPEPGAAMLIGLGLAGLTAVGRRA